MHRTPLVCAALEQGGANLWIIFIFIFIFGILSVVFLLEP